MIKQLFGSLPMPVNEAEKGPNRIGQVIMFESIDFSWIINKEISNIECQEYEIANHFPETTANLEYISTLQTMIRNFPFFHSWNFKLSNSGVIQTINNWRLFKKGHIILGSLDHKRPENMHFSKDVPSEVNYILQKKIVTDILCDSDSMDLSVFFNEDLRLELLVLTSDYSGWQLISPDFTVICPSANKELQIYK